MNLKINLKINELLKKINSTNYLKKYIKSFGIVGTFARKESFNYKNKIKSDIDFYVITNFINPFFESKFKKEISIIFGNEYDASLLIASPTIFKKPDLMFFEYTNSGKVLYGEKLKPISIKKISKFESFRNIIYRGCFFLSLFGVKNNKLKLIEKDKIKFLYYYSKVIFGIGEVFLILNKTYVANNYKRNELIKKNKFAKLLNEFIKEHNNMQRFRINNKIPLDFNFNTYTKKAFYYIEKCYEIMFIEMFNNDLNKFKKIKSSGISLFSSRFFFTLNNFKEYKKVAISINEPFIDLNIKFYNLSKKYNYNKKIYSTELKDILRYWKTAPWVYYYI